jgi:hypothetical protein
MPTIWGRARRKRCPRQVNETCAPMTWENACLHIAPLRLRQWLATVLRVHSNGVQVTSSCQMPSGSFLHPMLLVPFTRKNAEAHLLSLT